MSLFKKACAMQGWHTTSQVVNAFQETADRLGEVAAVTDRQVRRWQSSQPPMPRARAWRVLHAMLGVDPGDLGFPGPPPGVTVGGRSLLTQKGADVDRRAFMADSLGAAAGVGIPSRGRPLPPPTSRGGVGTAHLAELRDGLATLYELDDAYGGSEVRSLAVRHLRRVRRIIAEATYPDVIGRQLHLLAGESAEQCGWIHFDSGDHEAARRYWGDAMTVATALGDESLEILVLSALSLQANHTGRPRDGLMLARAAQDRAARQGSPALQSLIAAREARALTLLGDASGASRLLARAMRLLEKRGPAAPSWAAFHGQAELAYAQGLYYVDTGRPAAGVSFLRAALAHQTRVYSRNLTLYRLRLAGALAGAGELDEAADEAVRAVEHLDEVESGRVRRLAENVRTQLAGTSSVQAAAAAEEMDDRMRSRGDDF